MSNQPCLSRSLQPLPFLPFVRRSESKSPSWSRGGRSSISCRSRRMDGLSEIKGAEWVCARLLARGALDIKAVMETSSSDVHAQDGFWFPLIEGAYETRAMVSGGQAYWLENVGGQTAAAQCLLPTYCYVAADVCAGAGRGWLESGEWREWRARARAMREERRGEKGDSWGWGCTRVVFEGWDGCSLFYYCGWGLRGPDAAKAYKKASKQIVTNNCLALIVFAGDFPIQPV